jgi:glycerol-3-phosphate acyltransferase PlsY
VFWVTSAAVLVFAYALGAIPWALIIGKLTSGIDPREHGSGNLGATNVFRVLGPKAGIATLVLDAAKGALAVAVARMVVTPEAYGAEAAGWVSVAAMLAAVLGHSYSPYIGFKGGKGVATSAGALAVLTPLAFLLEITLFALVFALFRMVSLSSIVVALTYPVLVLVLYPGNVPVTVMVFVLAALVIWRHRTNIVRIARGEERRLSLSGGDGGRPDGSEGKR